MKTSNITTSQSTTGTDINITNQTKDLEIKTAAMETIHVISQEYEADEKSKLREINKFCLKMTQRMSTQDQCHTEDLLLKCKQRIIQLENINYNCYQFMGELTSKIDNLNEEDEQ